MNIEPATKVVQEDVSKFLKCWFMGLTPNGTPSSTYWKDVGGSAEKAGYAFREHHQPATYNEYFYAPTIAGRQEEKQLEDAIVDAQLSGEAPSRGLWAWIKRKFQRDSGT